LVKNPASRFQINGNGNADPVPGVSTCSVNPICSEEDTL